MASFDLRFIHFIRIARWFRFIIVIVSPLSSGWPFGLRRIELVIKLNVILYLLNWLQTMVLKRSSESREAECLSWNKQLQYRSIGYIVVLR